MFQLAVFGCLTFLCSCAAMPHQAAIAPAAELPGDVTFKKGADDLVVKLRFEDGQESPFIVDTGTSGTFLPKSMLRELGKRVGTATVSGWSTKEKSGLYAAPKLYLGNTKLMTGNLVGICSHGKTGILGMDCLQHYCIQLNFATGKMRFLDPHDADSAGWGMSFPLAFSRNVPFIHDGLLAESGSETMIDTGLDADGSLARRQLEQTVREQNGRFAVRVDHGVVKGHWRGMASFHRFTWSGQTYTNLVIGSGPPNSIGLRFLARHELVTFDFPKRMMYLAQVPNPNWTDNFFHERDPE